MALEVVVLFGFDTVDVIIIIIIVVVVIAAADDDGNGNDDDDDDDDDNDDDDDDSMLLLRVCVGLISDAESPSCDPVVFVFDCLSSNMTLFIRKRNT